MLPPAGGGWGTWREAGVAPAAALRRVPSDLPLALAATLAVNPHTALRLLEDFAALRPGARRDAAHGRGQPDADAAPITCTPASGDTLVQNGAGSGVGRAVIQLAAARGVRTVNILRDRRAPPAASGGAQAGACSRTPSTHADERFTLQARV